MRKIRAMLNRIRGLWHRSSGEAEFSAELEAHISMHVDDGVRSGLDPEEARRRALILLGGAEQVRQAHRERNGLPWQSIRRSPRLR